VADDERDARKLFLAGLKAARDRSVIVDVPAAQRTFLDWIASMGFTCQRPLTRMTLGQSPREQPDRVYALAGPEFG
jgi:hypothetical protein